MKRSHATTSMGSTRTPRQNRRRTQSTSMVIKVGTTTSGDKPMRRLRRSAAPGIQTATTSPLTVDVAEIEPENDTELEVTPEITAEITPALRVVSNPGYRPDASPFGRKEGSREGVTQFSGDRHDVLGRYMEELRKYPILDREKEHELALHYEKTQDADAARSLIGSNLRLVVKLAREYQGATQNLLDLVQEGNLGLVRSLKTYEPSRGIRLSTYASWWIRAYILKYILDNARLVRFGKTEAQRKLFFNLRKERDKLEAQGITPDAEVLAQRLNVPERDVVAMERRLAQPDFSLDAPVDRNEDDGRSYMDRLESPNNERPDLLVEASDHREHLRRTVMAFASTLNGRDRVIFDERLHADEPETLQTLADRFGISRERTRQLEQRIVDGLRSFVKDKLDGATLAAIPLAA
jgi:RNA polymerase sigma-32 factor